MLMFGEYQNIMVSCEGPIKWAHCQKKGGGGFRMHSQLINMDLHEGMIIKNI
jgi:hypothetical protein